MPALGEETTHEMGTGPTMGGAMDDTLINKVLVLRYGGIVLP